MYAYVFVYVYYTYRVVFVYTCEIGENVSFGGD